MQRTEQDVIDLGDFCKSILASDAFNSLYHEFKEDHFNLLLSTQPHEAKKREGIYAEMSALQTFLGLMQGYVARRDEIIKSEDQPSIPVEDDVDDE